MTYHHVRPVQGNPTTRDDAMLAAGWTRRLSGTWHHRDTGILVHRHESGWRAVDADGAVLVRADTLGAAADTALALVNGQVRDKSAGAVLFVTGGGEKP